MKTKQIVISLAVLLLIVILVVIFRPGKVKDIPVIENLVGNSETAEDTILENKTEESSGGLGGFFGGFFGGGKSTGSGSTGSGGGGGPGSGGTTTIDTGSSTILGGGSTSTTTTVVGGSTSTTTTIIGGSTTTTTTVIGGSTSTTTTIIGGGSTSSTSTSVAGVTCPNNFNIGYDYSCMGTSTNTDDNVYVSVAYPGLPGYNVQVYVDGNLEGNTYADSTTIGTLQSDVMTSWWRSQSGSGSKTFNVAIDYGSGCSQTGSVTVTLSSDCLD